MSNAATPTRPQTIARAAMLVAVVTVLARLIGFVRVLVFARAVGPSCLGDTYFTANAIPNILFDVVAGGALASLAVPLLAPSVERGDGEASDRTASALLCWTLLILVPLMVLVAVLAHPLVAALVGNGHPGCSASLERSVGARMLIVFAPQVVLYGVGIVLTGVLQAHRRFAGPALAPLLSSLVVIGSYVMFALIADRRETSLTSLTRSHELVLSVGTTLGVVMLTLPLFLPLRGTGRRLQMTLRFPAGIAGSARRLAVSGAIALGAQDLATAAILRLANDRGDHGAVVLYNLAWSVFVVPWAVLAVPVATAAFPALSAQWAAGDSGGYAALTARGARTVLLAATGAAALMLAVASPAARVLVVGAPGHVAPGVLTRALIAFAPGLIGYGLVAFLTRAHYARGDSKTAAVAAAAGWTVVVVVDVVLAIALPRDWTVAALGIGTSVGMTIAGAWLATSLRRSIGSTVLAGTGRALAAGVAAALVAAGVGAVIAVALPNAGPSLSVAITAIVGAATLGIFLGVASMLDRPTVRLVMRRRATDG
ncbi:MAG TPA: lipid II flippase MurJ [Mycobacteriales bacterium]|nr:lipid II flippase MurJ [Mycobacteriales bacterium]